MVNGLPGLFDADVTRVIVADPIRRFRPDPKLVARWCEHPLTDVELVAVVTRARDKQFHPCCRMCGWYPSGWSIAHDMLTEKERADIRIVRTNKEKPDAECQRCHKMTRVETHHWAPAARFADSHLWPTSELCQPCHARWHQVMNVTED